MLALPGSAYMYQGEELGLPEVADIPAQYLQDPTWERSEHHDKGRDGCRVPLPWESDGPSFGFGSAGAWIPQPKDWASLAWTAQEGDSASVLELYRTALGWRRTFAAAFAADETLTWLDKGPTTLSFARARSRRRSRGQKPLRLGQRRLNLRRILPSRQRHLGRAASPAAPRWNAAISGCASARPDATSVSPTAPCIRTRSARSTDR